jgi:hypothetical protein
MLIALMHIHGDDDMYKPLAPDSGAFMIWWMFMMSSFAIFVVGMFNLLTT